MKENTTITVVIDTIALGPTTENIVVIENIADIGTIEVIGHTIGVITAINAFRWRVFNVNYLGRCAAAPTRFILPGWINVHLLSQIGARLFQFSDADI